ncbi:MAG: hypothetical protein JRJ69_18295 [Deltaproteobacteria bacterium]|nr:hypothetical protein [Deltaproteobacteria bacterium]
MVNWKHVRYFRPYEFDDPDFPGSGEQIDGTLLFALDRLRHQTGWPIRIHREAGGGVDVGGTHGHSPASYHLLAMGARAADWHFETDAPVRIQIREVLRFGFGGTGIYFDWGIPVGFHTDTRPHARYQVWTRRNGKYLYLVRG